MFDGKLVESGDKFLSNLLIARERWLKTPVDNVIPWLGGWRCGTQACFGAHLYTWEEFRAQGVYNGYGAPRIMVGQHERVGASVADLLFGDASLFEMAHHCSTSASAHAEVVRRLDRAIATRRAELATVTA